MGRLLDLMKKRKILIVSLLLGAVLLLFSYLRYLDFSAASKLRIIFFDVGQGDSALIITPSGRTILVDGGEGEAVLSKLGATLPFYRQKIDMMILTHPHADHLEGLIPVLKKYQVEQIFYSGAAHTTNAFWEWLNLIKEKNINLKIIKQQEELFVESGVKLDFLYPRSDLTAFAGAQPQSDLVEESKFQKDNELNNTSIVFKLTYGQIGFLFTGDAETPVEKELLRAAGDSPSLLQSDVLKVAHHGSRSSTSEEFLRAVQPKMAVISAGRGNDFGHPHLRTLRRLERRGAAIYRTDELGDIELESDGKKVIKKS